MVGVSCHGVTVLASRFWCCRGNNLQGKLHQSEKVEHGLKLEMENNVLQGFEIGRVTEWCRKKYRFQPHITPYCSFFDESSESDLALRTVHEIHNIVLVGGASANGRE